METKYFEGKKEPLKFELRLSFFHRSPAGSCMDLNVKLEEILSHSWKHFYISAPNN